MSRYIDADKLHDDLTKIRINLMQEGVDITPIWQALDCVRQQPTADVRENVKAEWIKEIKHYKDDEQEYDYYDIYCSACGEKPEKAWHLTNYCPNCGADMRGEA